MQIGILKKVDGSVSIVVPSKEALKKKSIEDIIKKANTANLPVDIIDSEELPDDRVFRNAWELVDGKIEINRKKAEALHMDRLRILRNKQLLTLDKEYIIALENDDIEKLQMIKNLKQDLRTMPKTFKLDRHDLKSLHKQKPNYLEGNIEELKTKVPKMEK